ncbi:UDP-N-acetylmuramate--L-alanine ligase [Methanobrevibacter thaueri]|uniref:UDP-N-acetylmuramate--L-alanine ligase n=1 Tax=Methanobrevibacter thaueri TaxID=190975 RepID=A0A315XLS7_9EURY|nr:Mur ligase family protein [Methanobrevibacter thaueri]PWB87327.1 UDP-N-acetylmuramate--L-alanine ligase [Methanobrevibacter thaueri]
MNIQDLANSINGKLVGNDEFFSIDGFTGKITFLNDAHTGDIVIRESIDPAGVEIAFNKNIACLITPDPKEGTVEAAERLNFPLIIIDDIETAKEYVSKMAEEEKSKEHVGLVKKVEEKIIGDESFSIGGITEKISSIGSNLTHVIDSSYEEKLTDINDLAEAVEGKLVGNDEFFSIDGFTGKFTFLNNAHTGDIVIRHWINGAGVEMAFNKNIACLITQTPKEDAVEVAEKLNFPLIITDKIELANAYALSHTIEKYSPDSTNVVITGTNGKSTTSHLIYHILNNAGHHVLTNTDSESEFNTLIDPMVSKLISDEVTENGALDYLVIEVSEVQGWLDKLMKNHAALMSEAANPKVGVITNIAMDHIGLVNSIEDVFDEIKAVPEAIGDGVTILNHDDELVMKLDAKNPFYTSMSPLDEENAVCFDGENIIYNNDSILTIDELPFKGNHFIQNILSAIGACISLGIDLEVIVEGVKSYKALNRRFAKLSEDPLIYDDFAHNPDGIKATISETLKLLPENQKLHVACAIRGSRGVEINQLNVDALVESMTDDMVLYLSSSNDVVNDLNFVEDDEREVFFNTLNRNNIDYTHFDNLSDCLNEVCSKADINDIILLIGAQGMDPAESLLKDIK